MRKLKLRIEDLTVESLVTGDTGGARGTVRGAITYIPQPAQDQPPPPVPADGGGDGGGRVRRRRSDVRVVGLHHRHVRRHLRRRKHLPGHLLPSAHRLADVRLVVPLRLNPG